MLVFLRCDFIQSISFVHIIATRKTKTTSLCISSSFFPLFFTSGEFFSFYFSLLLSYPPPPSFYLLLIASDSKLLSNNAVMRASMILPAPGSSDKYYSNFPMEHGERCGFSSG